MLIGSNTVCVSTRCWLLCCLLNYDYDDLLLVNASAGRLGKLDNLKPFVSTGRRQPGPSVRPSLQPVPGTQRLQREVFQWVKQEMWQGGQQLRRQLKVNESTERKPPKTWPANSDWENWSFITLDFFKYVDFFEIYYVCYVYAKFYCCFGWSK